MIPRINPKHARFRLRIRRSAIEGWGIFALEAIPRGSKVIEYTGDRLSLEQAARRFAKNQTMGARRKNLYFARLNRSCIIDGYARGSGAQYANHCCDASLRPQRLQGRLWFISRRRILAGEELTVDYLYAKDSPPNRCLCGSRRCRGTMNRV